MNKRMFLKVLIFLPLFLGACGITEELEQAKNSVNDLKVNIETQTKNYQQLSLYLNEIPEAFTTDMEASPETGLFPEETGAIFDNYTLRQELHQEMVSQQKAIKKHKKSLDQIIKNNGADVDNAQLKLISNSLSIIISNFDSLSIYVETSIAQEIDFYADLPSDNMAEELSIVQRTYGAMDIISEEAEANNTYTLSLIKTFIKEAPKSKEKSK